MTKRMHIIYLSVIAVLTVAAVGSIFLASRGAFADAEKLTILPMKSVNLDKSGLLGDWVTVEGTWRIDNEKTGFPKHVIRYECRKPNNYCESAEALVYGNNLSVKMSKLDISKWDDQQLIMEESAECRSNTIIVNFLSQEVTAVVKDVPNRQATCDSSSPPLTQPRLSHLVSGWDESFPKAKR